MATVTKKDLIDSVAQTTDQKRIVVKRTIQRFLDEIITELGKGNRLEFREFGVFEVRKRQSRTAQNPKTLERVIVPPKKVVKFKVGRLMQQALDKSDDSLEPRTSTPKVEVHSVGFKSDGQPASRRLTHP